jgi:hypothetical protein
VLALVLDVDALVHARRPGLVPEIEALIVSLPGRAYMERSVYRRDAARSGLLPLLDQWQQANLLDVSVDYRALPDGDRRFQALTRQPQWRALSRPDRAILLLATEIEDAAVLTCERLLAAAARAHRRRAIDLFDIIRIGFANGRVTETRAREICAEWDRDRFSAGRPIDYAGTFDQELRRRHAADPLSF